MMKKLLLVLAVVLLMALTPAAQSMGLATAGTLVAASDTCEEIASLFDVDGNGQVNPIEAEVGRFAFWVLFKPAHSAAPLQAEKSNNFSLDADEMLRRFDKNSDGKLDQEERDSAREHIVQLAAEIIPKLKDFFDADGDDELSAKEQQSVRQAFKSIC